MTEVRPTATEVQNAASAPGASTWLAANAGSGKTRVLTDRVARLLLNGADPQSILCLTYTKAAAGEMQNRLFRTLGEWAMKGDAELRESLSALGEVENIEPNRARTLFARAIETPGGLKIQTIHSFCASLLRRFPVEARIPPRFTELDDAAQRHLIQEALDRLADGPRQAAYDDFAFDEGREVLVAARNILSKRGAFLVDAPTPEEVFGPEIGSEELLDRVAPDPDLLRRVISVLSNGSSNDQKAAQRLRVIPLDDIGVSALGVLESVLLSGANAKDPFGSKAGQFPTKETRDKLGSDLEPLNALMDRVAETRRVRVATLAAQKTRILRDFATAFLATYDSLKAERGLLDFDDLILATKRLLSDPGVAAWVLYKIDGGIDHVLVDEAQDTAPEQWDVIDRLTAEFGVGEGARPEAARSLFVVGDKKQSIYSFQGADAEQFDTMRDRIGGRIARQQGLQDLELAFSFRSSPAILRAVDYTFSGTPDLPTKHEAFWSTMPGRVDLWPLVPSPEKAEDLPWYDPTDRVAPNHQSHTLAECIATWIREAIDTRVQISDRSGRTRPITAGDFLILVRGRSGQGNLFDALIRSLKDAGLPVAGADRLSVGDALAVKDILALLRFLDLPEDDLSLAAALRSPLFGLSERDLYDLAATRTTRFLWQALRSESKKLGPAQAMIGDLLDQADFLRPYDLIERILIRHDGRRRLTTRLGHEIDDPLDALLNLALSYEQSHVPSLTGFLEWMVAEESEVKRSPDGSAGLVQVMTVHGAKGLERPVVILPDTTRSLGQNAGSIVTDGANGPFPAMSKAEGPPQIEAMKDAQKEKDLREAWRLLYVAMTRAESWLVVCGPESGKGADLSWYRAVKDGLEAAGSESLETPTGKGRRLAQNPWPDSAPLSPPEEADPLDRVPEWVGTTRDPRPGAPHALSPADLGGAKVVAGDDGLPGEQARTRGSALHALLEHLPQLPEPDWPDWARAHLGLDEEMSEDVLREAGALLKSPDFAWIFGEGSEAEVALSAPVPELHGRRIRGAIDRIVVSNDRVTAVDFKSNAVVPATIDEVPEGFLRQLGAYRAALTQIYSDRPVDVGILWTRRALYTAIPHDIVRAALERTPIS